MFIAEDPVSGTELRVWGMSPARKFQGLFCKIGACRRVVEEVSEVHACFPDYFLSSWAFIFLSSKFALERSLLKSLMWGCTKISKLVGEGCS